MAKFTGLPDQLIISRDHIFTIDQISGGNGWVESDFAVTMREGDEVFHQGSFPELNLDDERMFIRADPGDGPLTVAASYTEYQMYPISQSCSRTIEKTMPLKFGSLMPRPKVKAGYERAHVTLAGAPSCTTTKDPTPVLLSVKPKRGRTWTTVSATDQCYGWDRGGRGPGFSLGRESARELAFVPRTAARDSVKLFDYRLVAGRFSGEQVVPDHTMRSGHIRVRTSHYPAERVYGFKKNGDINDRYWNYCVNEAKTVYMHNGNPYCIDPAFTYRAVSLRR